MVVVYLVAGTRGLGIHNTKRRSEMQIWNRESSGDFDPYREWLEIAPSEQPPNYYRLLGLPTFETDAAAIARAADARELHLSQFVAGPHAELSAILIAHIAAAKQCLLEDSSKDRYDRQLRVHESNTTASTVTGNTSTTAISRRVGEALLARIFSRTFVILGIAATVCVALAYSSLEFVGRLPSSAKVAAESVQPSAGEPTIEGNESASPSVAETGEDKETVSEAVPPQEKPEPDLNIDTSADRIPVPTQDAQDEALKDIREVFKADYDTAVTRSAKIALARKIIHAAETTSSDHVSQFVLLRIARDISAQVGDAKTTFLAVDGVTNRFDVRPLEYTAETLSLLRKNVNLLSDQQTVAMHAKSALEEAIALDQYTMAQDLGSVALTAARSAGDITLAKAIQTRIEEAVQISARRQTLADSLKTLEGLPSDPTSNLEVGKFQCFMKGNWDTGLPMLALGNDEELRRLAILESNEIADALAIGDGWWECSNGEDGIAKKTILQHAATWYETALPTLSGLAKAKVEARLKSLESADNVNDSPPNVEWTSLTAFPPSKVDAAREHDYYAISATTDVRKHRLLSLLRDPPTGNWVFLHPYRSGKPAKATWRFQKPVKAFECAVDIPSPAGKGVFRILSNNRSIGAITVAGSEQPKKITVELENCIELTLIIETVNNQFMHCLGLWLDPRVRQ